MASLVGASGRKVKSSSGHGLDARLRPLAAVRFDLRQEFLFWQDSRPRELMQINSAAEAAPRGPFGGLGNARYFSTSRAASMMVFGAE